MQLSLVSIQAATFVGLAVLFTCQGNWRYGLAQALLAGVTVVIYA